MKNTKWIINPPVEDLDPAVYGDLDPDVAAILYHRNIRRTEDVARFLEGTAADLPDPLLFEDMEKAVTRLRQALEKNENIWIYGDYDVDGITATSLLILALRRLGAAPRYYIPLREEGYGLNTQAIEEIAALGANLVITVDCGVTSVNEAQRCRELGMDMILTDHHEITGELPPAYAVINPRRPENRWPYPYLSGVGTAFTLIRALYGALGRKDEALDYIDMAAVGTVADIVPLTGDNRIITKTGLRQLPQSRSAGFKMLLSQLWPDWETRTYTPFDVGFVIGPLFNAAGRLEDAKKAVELFISEDRKKLMDIISSLIENNKERKRIQEEIFRTVVAKITREKADRHKILIAGGEGFHHGVIGIVASKVLERWYRPVIIYEIKPQEGIATASCRSIEGFDITAALVAHREYFEKFGGHAMAAGFTVSLEKLPELTEKLIAYAGERLTDEDLKQPVKIERRLPLSKLNYDFYQKLSRLEPYGQGNPTPVFAALGCKRERMRLIGKDKNHLMTDLLNDGYEAKNCVWFQSAACYEELQKQPQALVDAAFRLRLETWLGRFQVKCHIEDMRFSEEKSGDRAEAAAPETQRFPMEAVVYTKKETGSDNWSLEFSEKGVAVRQNKMIVDMLDPATAGILTSLRQRKRRNFLVSHKETATMAEHYRIHLLIEPDWRFESLALKEAQLFREIKEFLIGEAEYNPIQKSVFRAVFFEKKNVFLQRRQGAGIRTILKTLGFYFQNSGKTAVLVTKGPVSPDVAAALHVAASPPEKADFTLWLDPDGDMLRVLRESPGTGGHLVIGDETCDPGGGFSSLAEEI